ncbi:multi-sensor hybrid histidine kinase, partial [Candidatus Magnetomorum sp. HK-1]
KEKNYINAINSSGRSLLSIINDILDLSKIEAGKMDINLEPVNIKNIFNELEKVFSLKIQEKSIKMLIDIDTALPDYLVLDETRLRQIMFNLIGNSVKFTQNGLIVVSIQKMSESQNGKTLEFKISISDTGIGMTKDFLNHLFEPFKQFEDNDCKKFQGTGLGLSITKRLAEMMNGDITVESELGKGTTFEILFQNIAFQDNCIESHKNDIIDIKNISFTNSTILVVDDIKMNRIVAKEYLRLSGIEIAEAEDGEKAVSYAKQYKPDAILMDIRMPNMDGYEATKLIKTNPDIKHIPVIALTASVLEDDILLLKKAPFDDILTKPIKHSKLLEVLSRHLSFKQNIKHDNSIPDIKLNSSPESPKKIDNNVTLEHKSSELISCLEKNFLTKWQEVVQRQYVPDIEKFILEIKALAEEYHSFLLADFSDKLALDMDLFDIENLKKSLMHFPDLINKLKG